MSQVSQNRHEMHEERKKYQEIYLPLYEASIRCDWKAAEAILDKNRDMNLLRQSITINGETALHIAASVKGSKKVDEFVRNLVGRMRAEDLELVNNDKSTALYLAAAAGNIETVKIMMEENSNLDTIPGGGGDKMPLYAAVLFGNKDVARYLYESSDNLRKVGLEDITVDWNVWNVRNCKVVWNNTNRDQLLKKCVESDMFDIALKIMEPRWWHDSDLGTLLALLARKHEAFNKKQSSNKESNIIRRIIKYDIAVQIVKKCECLGKSINLLGLLARKLEAFHEKKSSNTESNMIGRTVKSVFAFIGYKAGTPVEKNDALPLLRCIWGDIVKFLSKEKIDDILRGPPDSIKLGPGRIVQTMQLKALIFARLDKLDEDAKKIRNQERLIFYRLDKLDEDAKKIRNQERLIFDRLDKLDEDAKEKKNQETQRRQRQRILPLAMVRETERIFPLAMVRESARERERVDDIFQKLKDLVSKYVEDMHFKTRSIIKQENTTDEDQALKLQKLISEFIVKLHDETKNMPASLSTDKGGDVFEYGGPAQRLLNLIFDHIKKMRAETKIIDDTRSYSSRVLFIAAEVGNTNFLLELIRRQPDLIWQVDDNGLSIFHVAVKHRHEGIYNLLYEIGSMKDMVTPLKDNDGNNMLHLAAMRTRNKNLEDVSGAALQMQRELLWFKEVERMIPPYLRESKNKDGFTPYELFTMEHQCLIDQGEQWMKSTAKDCMVVATLTATIVFAAAFTVPGGYNQNDGIPMFKRKLSFVAFVVADAISLVLSSASILTFLSILTSRYAERDFVAKLPMKLMSGLVTLFLSIGTMMVTFSISFFVLYHKEMKWIPIFISGFAVIPAILYVVLQFHLLVDVVRSTYGGKYLFKPARQVLFYYEKPQDLTDIICE